MEPEALTRVLVVAHEAAESSELREAVARRATQGRCAFTLLVPRRPRARQPSSDPERERRTEAQARLEAAIPGLEDAAGAPVVPVLGSPDALATIADALSLLGFDEVIISTPPADRSSWLRLDLPSKVRALACQLL